jgi:hypothetical protein
MWKLKYKNFNLGKGKVYLNLLNINDIAANNVSSNQLNIVNIKLVIIKNINGLVIYFNMPYWIMFLIDMKQVFMHISKNRLLLTINVCAIEY